MNSEGFPTDFGTAVGRGLGGRVWATEGVPNRAASGRAMQVLPDFAGFAPPGFFSLENLPDDTSLEDWAEQLQAKEDQNSCIRRFLDTDADDNISAPVYYRRSTWKILHALDHALNLSTGRGLEGWFQTEEGIQEIEPLKRSLAEAHLTTVPRGPSVVADQAGSGRTSPLSST